MSFTFQMKEGVAVKIKMLCTVVQSFIQGHGCWPPGPGCSVQADSPKEVGYEVNFELADQTVGRGSIAIRVKDEDELAKWIPGQEYEVEIGVPAASDYKSFDEMMIDTIALQGQMAAKMNTVEPEEVPIEKYFEHLEKMGLIQRVPETELNDDGIAGMYSDLPLPVGTAEGGVQPVVDEDKPIAYVKRPMLEFDPPRAVPTDLEVDADE